MKTLKKYIYCLVALVLTAACENDKEAFDVKNGTVAVNFAATRLAGDANGQPDATINVVNGYRFDNGVLKEIYAGVKTVVKIDFF